MTDLLQHPYAQALARALLHFIWQGAAIGLIGAGVLRAFRHSPSARYLCGVACLVTMFVAPMATTWYLANGSAAAQAASARGAHEVATAVATSSSASAPQEPSAPITATAGGARVALVLAVWLAGVTVLSIRLIGGWIVARRMARRAVRLAAPEIQSLARRVAGRLALDRVVRVVESPAVAVPVMIGWIKPVVILPAAALAGLTPMQVEALLAHELAHVFRHDYVVNLLQALVETVLFYQPAVWWISHEVRQAREQCCDDMAVGVCDRLAYATALAELAATTAPPRLALAAADGSLVDRVRRILGRPPTAPGSRSGWIPVALLSLLVASVVPVVWSPGASAAEPQTVASKPPVQGVPGGVVEGVVGGVQGGVVSGAVAGVVGGVAGGVTGGVTEGVVGGVQGGVTGGFVAPRGTDPQEVQTESPANELALLKKQIDELKQRMERVKTLKDRGLAAQDNVDNLQQMLNELQRKTSALSAALDNTGAGDDLQARELKLDLEAAQQKYERAKKLSESGLTSSRDVAAAEEQVKRLEILLQASAAKGNVAEIQSKTDAALAKLADEAARREYERTKQLYDTGLVGSRQLDEATAAMKQREVEMAMAQDKLARAQAIALGPQASALRDRLLREGSSMSDDAVVALLKEAAKLSGDVDRAEVLLTVARQVTLTPEMVTQYVAAANGIGSADERARVFKQPIRLRDKPKKEK